MEGTMELYFYIGRSKGDMLGGQEISIDIVFEYTIETHIGLRLERLGLGDNRMIHAVQQLPCSSPMYTDHRA